MWNIVYLLTGFIFWLLIFISFMFKKKIHTEENRIFKWLIITNGIEYLFEILLQLYIRNRGIDAFPVDILCKLYLVSILSCYGVFSCYTFLVCFNNKDAEKRKKIYLICRNVNAIVCVLVSMMIFILPFEKIYDSSKMYTSGQAVDALKLFLGFYLIMWITLTLKNIKRIVQKKYVPIYVIIAIVIISVIIQSYDPSILVSTVFGTVVCYTMFHTIENPDIKLLEEYNHNRELVEKNIEDKTNMLFKISEDVRMPIVKIKLLNNEIARTKDLKVVKEKSENIDKITNNLVEIVDNVLDVSFVDKKNIKFYNTNYNIYNLFNLIICLIKNRVDSKIDFKYSITSTIPEVLYGDSAKLKQIICSLLLLSFKNTKSGVVDLDINSIIRYDVCRLIITIRDTSEGMSLFEINDILESNSDISEKGLESINDLELDIKVIKKIINLIGGTLLIKSDEGIGTTYTIVVNQRIVQDDKTKKIDKVAKALLNKDRVLLVDSDYKELEKLSRELRKNDFEVTTTLYGKDCIDRITNNEKYDYIFIDDEMEKYNAVMIINELQKLDIKKIKIIVMLGSDKENIKEHYLEDYPFYDYLIKSDYKNEISRIINK